jgi:hypothetical protein
MVDALGENDWDDWEDPERQGIRNQFRWSLQALACESSVQMQLFPERACKPYELASDYSHWAGAVQSRFASLISKEQLEAVRQIDSRLRALSRGGTVFREVLWQDDALSTQPEWNELRSMARSALEFFGWPIERPPNGRSRYLLGDGSWRDF